MNYNVVAHHVRLSAGAGMGMKPSDYRTVPLAFDEHHRLHNIGEREYWRINGLDPFKLMADYLVLYCYQRDQMNGLIDSIGGFIDGQPNEPHS